VVRAVSETPDMRGDHGAVARVGPEADAIALDEPARTSLIAHCAIAACYSRTCSRAVAATFRLGAGKPTTAWTHGPGSSGAATKGYVAKDEARPYVGGRTRLWLKVKVSGWTDPRDKFRRVPLQQSRPGWTTWPPRTSLSARCEPSVDRVQRSA
jgi:hypothetical protein